MIRLFTSCDSAIYFRCIGAAQLRAVALPTALGYLSAIHRRRIGAAQLRAVALPTALGYLSAIYRRLITAAQLRAVALPTAPARRTTRAHADDAVSDEPGHLRLPR